VSARPLKVIVSYAAPGVEAHIELVLPADSAVADAVEASGFIERFIRAAGPRRGCSPTGGSAAAKPQAWGSILALDRAMIGYAIFGQRARADTPLRDGDRVELTRPLLADPKDARRRRARDHPLATTRRRPTEFEA
jgi:putative ubiquitin-RnfH superfamily antitoxin RatB of RatAB toxin-antitoxin module